MTRPWRLVLLASLLSLATACGSTVQMSSTATTDPGLGGLGSSTGQAPAAVPSSAAAAVASGLPSSSVTGPTGTVAGPGTGVPGRANAAEPVSGASIPGITKTTITVGVLAADPGANKTLDSAGFGAASLGDEPASWRAMADEVNARGGLAGRRLVLVFYLVNLTDSPSTQGQAACEKFTQDNKVAVVLAGYYYASADRCLSQHGVPALLGTNYGVDSVQAPQTRMVVAWATPLLDRLAAVLPGAFQRMGKLKAGTAAGIFVVDAAPFRRSAAKLEAALKGAGLEVVTQAVRDSDGGDYSGAASDASAAVLRFRSAGVTEILFVTHNAFEPALLMQAANSQSYKPTYLLSTQQYPAGLVGLAPAGQLDGALAIGWAPAIDLSSGYDTSARAQECVRALKRQGRTYSSGTQELVGLLACDGIDLLKRATELPGGLTSREALRRAALSPATRFVSAVTFLTRFAGDRPDGVDAYRPLAFGSSCGCFTYTGPVTRM